MNCNCCNDQLRSLEMRTIALCIGIQQMNGWRNDAIERAEEADKKSAEVEVQNEELQRHCANRFVELFAGAEIEGFRVILEEPNVNEVVKIGVLLSELLQIKNRHEAAIAALDVARDEYRGATQGLEQLRAQYANGCEAYDAKLEEAKQQAASYKEAADSMLEAERMLTIEKDRLVGLKAMLAGEISSPRKLVKKKQQKAAVAEGESEREEAEAAKPPQKEPPELSQPSQVKRKKIVSCGQRRDSTKSGRKVSKSPRVKVVAEVPSS